MRRLLRVLPPGTLAVGGGLVVLGLASYVHLAVAGYALDLAGMSSVSVLWSIVFTLGPGLFFPIEQEITRLVAARRVAGAAAWPVLVRGGALAGMILVVLVAALAAGQGPLADRLFAGDRAQVWALAGAFTGLALAHTTRGLLAGLGQFPWYGLQLGVDGMLRIGIAGTLGLLGVTSPVWYGLVLTFAPVASVLCTLPPVLRAIGPGTRVGWSELMRGLGPLTVSALLAQLMVNIAVINARLLDPADVAAAGALLSALVLVRVPLFIFASLQAALLPGLSAAAAGGDAARWRRLLTQAVLVVTVLAGAGGVVVVVAGPWLITTLFDAASGVLSRGDFAWLAAGTLAYLWSLVLGQGLMAVRRHRHQTWAWLLGTAALLAVTAVPVTVTLRVELAYALGTTVVAATMAVMLARHRTGELAPIGTAAGVPTTTGGVR